MEKPDLLLLLLFASGKYDKKYESVKGITRLIKLIFLLKEEEGIKGYNFIPYKMGPFSSEVYSQIEFLRNYPTPDNPLINVELPAYSDRTQNLEQLKYASEMADDSAKEINFKEADATFSLSPIGQKLAEELWINQTAEIQHKIMKVKSKYASLPLRQLLKYVYTNYPSMTVNSEIKDQIL